MVDEFKMKDGDNWCKHLSGKLPKGQSTWGKNEWMCARWLTKGDCFVNCNNKACHVGAEAVVHQFSQQGQWHPHHLTP